MRLSYSICHLFLILLAINPPIACGQLADNWHQWRGPEANGVSRKAEPPVTWSETSNVQWKVAIDGLGNASPIVWNDKVFLLTAIDTTKIDPSRSKPEDQPERPFGITYPNTLYTYVVLCLDRNTGEEIWRRTAAEQVPNQGHHGDNSFASSSPTTDGERVYALFGSVGLFCYDLDGNLLWQRPFPAVETRLSFGEGGSPVVHGGKVIVNRDNETDSRITVLDALTGDVAWEHERDEISAWATPLVVDYGGTSQVITNATNRVRSYDLADGRLIWECSGQVSNVTPSPVRMGENVICMSGYRGSIAQSLPLSAKGDISGSDQIAWSFDRNTPYVPSPLLYDQLLYFNRQNDAIWSSLDARSGEAKLKETRIPNISRIYASPVGAAGRVYITGREGTTVVLAHGPEFKVLAENKLDDSFDASAAIAGKSLFLRGKQHLYSLAE